MNPQDCANLSEYLSEKGLVETARALRKEVQKRGGWHGSDFVLNQSQTPVELGGPFNTSLSFPSVTPSASSQTAALGFRNFHRTRSMPVTPVQAPISALKVPVSAPSSLFGGAEGGYRSSPSSVDYEHSPRPPRTSKQPTYQVRTVYDRRAFQLSELQLEESTEESDGQSAVSPRPSPFNAHSVGSSVDLASSPGTSVKGGVDAASDGELSPIFEMSAPAKSAAAVDLSRVDSLTESQEISDMMGELTLSPGDLLSQRLEKDALLADDDGDGGADFDFFSNRTKPTDTCTTQATTLKCTSSGESASESKLKEASLREEGKGGGFSFPTTPKSEEEAEPIFATWQSFNSQYSGDLGSVSSLARAYSVEGGGSSIGEGQSVSGISKEDASIPKASPRNIEEWDLILDQGKRKESGGLLSTGGSFQTGVDPSMGESSEANHDLDVVNFLNSSQECSNEYVYSEEYIQERYDVIDLKIYHKRGATGFESSKELHMESGDVVAGRYQIGSVVGRAAFSQAYEAYDLKERRAVCLKMVKNNKDYFDQSLDEIKLLRYISGKDPHDEMGIVRMLEFFYYKEHLFLVFELLGDNLYEVQRTCLKSPTAPYYFSLPKIQFIATQVLRALSFLHGLNIIHSDLKPENILFKSMDKCLVKVIDLGSSCFATDYLGSYVQSRSYRAPEVILGLPYDHRVDIWSLGCVLAELAGGYVLFQSTCLAGLLARIEAVKGALPKYMMTEGTNSHKFYTVSGRIFRENRTTQEYEILSPVPNSLANCIRGMDEGFIEFLSMLLTVDPAERPTAREALGHPWLQHDYLPSPSKAEVRLDNWFPMSS